MNKKKIFISSLFAFLLVATTNTTVVTKAATDSFTTTTISMTDMVLYTAQSSGEMYTAQFDFVDFGVFHGTAYDGNIQKFTTYTFDGATWSGTLGETTDNAYINPHWKLYTLNNDGIIVVIKAEKDLVVDINKTVIGGDWPDNCWVRTYKKGVEADAGIGLLKGTQLTADHTLEDFNGTFSLNAGETLYYEIVMPWDGTHRNMQNLPNFTFTSANTVVNSSPMTYAQTGVNATNNNARLRFATPVNGLDENSELSYTRKVEGKEDLTKPVETVYKAILANNAEQYFDGENVTTTKPENDYYWANYVVEYQDDTYKNSMITMVFNDKGTQRAFLTTSYSAMTTNNVTATFVDENNNLLGRSIIPFSSLALYSVANPTKDNATFKGWQWGNTVYTTLPTITTNAVFKAVFE